MKVHALTSVIAHGKAKDTFFRHLPIWKTYDQPIEVWCPVDDPIPQSECDIPINYVGMAEHCGPQAHLRLATMLSVLSRSDYDYHLIFEYDSLSLCPNIQWAPGFRGVLFANLERSRFFGKLYANPPWMMDAMTLRAMEATARRHPNVREEGFADRYLSALSILAGAKVQAFDPPGFSRAPIDLPELPAMKKAIDMGATMIHGVKSGWVLEAAQEFYRNRQLPAANCNVKVT